MEALTARAGGLAVVLGGGADLGAFEVGVVDALARGGVAPDLLVGTSVGALNAAFWAFHPGPDAGERLLRVWLDLDGGLLSDHPWRLVARLVTRHDHLLGHSRLLALISAWSKGRKMIEDAAVPLAITATDLASGGRVVLRHGDLRTALLASSAIPVVFSPVRMDGRLLADGGIVASCDLQTPAEAGMSETIAVDLAPADTFVGQRDLGTVLTHVLSVSARRQTDLASAAFGGNMRITLVRPELRWPRRYFDLAHTRELFAMGREAGLRLLEARALSASGRSAADPPAGTRPGSRPRPRSRARARRHAATARDRGGSCPPRCDRGRHAPAG